MAALTTGNPIFRTSTANGSMTARIPTSFEQFWQDEIDSLYRALSLSLGDADLAHNAVDEGMARAYQNWGKISGYDKPAGWVYRVSFNWATSWRRKRRREVVTDQVTEQPIGADGGFGQPLDPALKDALATLAPPARAVVVLRYLLGWSTAETAEALGIAEGTVKSRLARALTTLESALEER